MAQLFNKWVPPKLVTSSVEKGGRMIYSTCKTLTFLWEGVVLLIISTDNWMHHELRWTKWSHFQLRTQSLLEVFPGCSKVTIVVVTLWIKPGLSVGFQLTGSIQALRMIILRSAENGGAVLCVLDVLNKKGGDFGLKRDHHLMVTWVDLCFSSAVSRSVGTLRPPTIFNTNELHGPAVAR